MVKFAYKDCEAGNENKNNIAIMCFMIKNLNFALPNYTPQSYHPISVFHGPQHL